TLEGYQGAARQLENEGHPIVLLGVKAEQSLCDEVAGVLKSPINLCGQTSLVELGHVLKQATLLLCNDSGTMHVATAMGTPVVSVFGPTVTAQGFRPWSKTSRVAEVNLGCRPCGAHGHDQ